MRIGASSNLSEEIIRILYHDFVIISSLHFFYKVTNATINMCGRIIEEDETIFYKKLIHVFKITLHEFVLMIPINVSETDRASTAHSPVEHIRNLSVFFPVLKKIIREYFNGMRQSVSTEKFCVSQK